MNSEPKTIEQEEPACAKCGSEKDRVALAGKIREAMIHCAEQRADGRYYATEAGCEKLREILKGHGIRAIVEVGEDGRFEVRPELPTVHTCHWPGCGKAIAPHLWGCKEHWLRLPKRLRNEIWGSPDRKRYIEAAQEVQKWIASQSR